MITLVLAGSRNQFEDCPRDRKMVYVQDLQAARGLNEPVRIEVVGTFWSCRDAAERYAMVRYVQDLCRDRPDPDAGPTSR
jgi:hypothetical protein